MDSTTEISSVMALPGLLVWLASGDRGSSSEAIVQHITGIPACDGHFPAYPYDPDDLIRCEKLLRAVPGLRALFPRMASCHPVWAALLPRWHEIAALIYQEAPDWDKGKGSAPKAYALMSELTRGLK